MTPSHVRLGPALRRAWIGYQRQLDELMTAAGFGDRAFPDGRVLRMCRDAPDTTISQIGRELGITRQGASKIVGTLRDRGYITVTPSQTNGREKVVTTTPRAREYLETQRKAAGAIERSVRAELGPEAFTTLQRLLDHFGGNEDLRLREYLGKMGVHEL